MSKSTKKHKSSKFPKSVPAVHVAEIKTEPELLLEPEPKIHSSRTLEFRTLVGIIHTDLYDRLIKPALVSFALRHDDEPLHQLVESIVTSIAIHDAYEGYRKIDDICQRYLYYLESIENTVKSIEQIELSALCDYWRLQVFALLICDSAAIFELLLPAEQPKIPAPCTIEQHAFFNGIRTVFNAHLDPTSKLTAEHLRSEDVFQFAYGISYPWTGFPPENIFPIQTHLANDKIPSKHSFAMISAEQAHFFNQSIQNSLRNLLLIDIIYAQHRKVYDEISSAFAPDDILPDQICDQLSKRIKFDKIYQNAFDSILSGLPMTKPLHRSSRLNIEDLNAFGQFAGMIHRAAELNLGVFLFHCHI